MLEVHSKQGKTATDYVVKTGTDQPKKIASRKGKGTRNNKSYDHAK